MHKLFTIEYLVHEICSYMSLGELYVLARVSSTWFRCAIPLLYSQEDEMPVTLAPLGEIRSFADDVTNPSEVHWIFINPPSDEDLERFSLVYAPYVRSVTFGSRYLGIALEATRQCASRGIPYLFPNAHMVTLWFDGCEYPEYMEVLDHLFTPNVRRLYLNGIHDSHCFHDLCALAMTRICVLDLLDINGFLSNTKTEGQLMVRSLQELLAFYSSTMTSVHVPHAFNAPSIVECLSRMPNLSDLTLGYRDSNTVTCELAMYNNREGFPSLRSFSYLGPPKFLYNMFWRRYDLTSLTEFAWPTETTPVDVGMVISTLVTACPRLTSLMLGPLRYYWQSNPEVVVSWSYIQSIIRCKQLTHLSLNGMHIDVSLKELADFLKSRKTWTCLDIFTLDPLRLRDLLLYAKHCPNIQELGVLIDMEKEAEYHMDLENSHRDRDPLTFKFLVLKQINFSNSKITETNSHRLVQFLHRICESIPNVSMMDDAAKFHVSAQLAAAYLDKGSGSQ